MPVNTPSIGIIDPERLRFLPARYWGAHEFCFRLHDQILEMLKQYESSGAHNWVADAFSAALSDRNESTTDVDMLGFLKEHGLVNQYKHHIVAHLVLALTADMLHFLFEALRCFEKRKFAVGFSLLRKPLKENLLFLSWLLQDANEFVTRFESDTYETLNKIQPDRRLSIFRGAISKLATADAFDAQLLQDMIFSKSNPSGLEPLWQRASHLITSQGKLLQTEDLNINFVFHDAGSDSLFEPLYFNLPYLLIYATQVAIECFGCILRGNDRTISHLIVTTMGTYETLFSNDSPRYITRLLSRGLRPFLKCLHCDASLRLTRANTVKMYLHEQLECHKCRCSSPFPLYWLLSTANIQVERGHGATPMERS